jgi:hypothetical protein
VLTEPGARFARRVLEQLGRAEPGRRLGRLSPAEKARLRQLGPRWYKEAGDLRLGDIVVYHFKRLAPAQRAILDSFEEEVVDGHWPRAIDSPLGGKEGMRAAKRVHDAVNNLNRRQKLIRFHAADDGRRIWWEVLL